MAEAESNINSFELDLVSERTMLFDFDEKTLFTAKYEHKGQYHAYWEHLIYFSCFQKDIV